MHVWAHMSIAGWIFEAFKRSAVIWWDTLQIFAKSPRGWKLPEYTQEDYNKAMEWRKEYKQVGWVIHANYLANLAKPTEEAQVDINSIIHDLEVADATGFDSVNVHIGKEKGRESIAEAMENMKTNVKIITDHIKKNNLKPVFLFENTAGQGSEIGSNLDELAMLNDYLKDLPIKFCIDTAHSRWGGIDMTQWDQFVKDFDAKIGIDKLHSIHFNDSKAILWARLDRHAPLGRGFIGLPALAKIIKWANKNNVNIYLETTDPSLWPEEIEMIRKIAAGDDSFVEAFDKKYYKTEILKKYEWVDQGSLF